MIVEHCQIEKYLPEHPDAKIHVVFPETGEDAFTASPADIRALARERMISGEVSKNGRLKYVRLLVSVRAALRVQYRMQRHPMLPPHVISRLIQSKGRKTWIARLDNSKTGQIGKQSALWFEQRSENECPESVL